MARRPEDDWGRIPETKGHARLVRWLEEPVEPKRSVAILADLIGVKRASAHAWRWRDARPSDEMVGRLIDVIGGTREEWFTDAERKRLKKESRLRQRRVKELQKGAA